MPAKWYFAGGEKDFKPLISYVKDNFNQLGIIYVAYCIFYSIFEDFQWTSDGNKRILWACRISEALSNTVDWCRDYVPKLGVSNNSLPEIVEYYGSNSGKVSCILIASLFCRMM